MPEILINVVNKIPQLTGDVRQITSGNGDYTVRLVFDDDWADSEKTVLFVRENGFAYPAVRTENDCCAVPEVNGVPLREWLYVGVKQGDVHTSRPCGIPVYRSIDDMISDEAVQPDPSMWDDILARLIAVEENVDEVVAETVEEYLRENPISVPTKLSELENDTGFITRLVNDLANYYRKSETYTREEVDGKISAIPKFSIAVVDALPTENISGTTVYLVRSGDDSGDLYTEYIHANGAWEVLGSQKVDLTGYVTDAELTNALKEYAKLTDISAMTGATAAASGKSGMVPAPAAGQQDMVLHGDGTWRGIEIPETPESVPPGNLTIVVMGESLDNLAVVSVQYPADAPEGYQPEDSIAAGNVVVMLALVDQNGEDISEMSMGVLISVDGDVIQAPMNLVQEDAVTSLLLEADLVSMTARAIVYTEFAGGGAPEASGWVEILPETEGVNDDPDGVVIEIPAVLNVSPGDKCRVYWQGNKLTAEAEVTAVSGDFYGYPAVILADYTGDEFTAENVQTFVLWYIPSKGGLAAVDKANSTRCTVRIEKLVGENVTRAEFDALAETVSQHSEAIADKLDKSGGEMSGNIIVPAGGSVGIKTKEDVRIFGYGVIGETTHFRVGDPNYPAQLRGSETRPKYNNQELALYSDIAGAGLLTVETITIDDSGETETTPVESINLDYTTLTLDIGGTTQLAASVNPSNATNTAITWESSAEGIATVEDGFVTAVAAGSAIVTAKSVENPSITATCTVTVNESTGGETTGGKVQFSTLNMAQGFRKADGSVVTSLVGTWHVSFPYSEGMEVHAFGSASWNANTYPPIVVDDGENATIHAVEFDGNTITINGKTGQKYSATLTGYADGSTVYASFVAGTSDNLSDKTWADIMDDIYYYIPGGAE